jgi:UPF0755 protein
MSESNKKNDRKKLIKKNKFILFNFLKKYFSSNKIIRRGIIFLVAVFFVYAVMLLNYSFSTIDMKNVNVVIDIPTGSSFWKSMEILDNAGLIKNRIFFYNLAVIKRARLKIRAGEYEINTLITPWQMINKLMRGDVKIYKIIVREDLSLREIAEILEKDKLINKEIFFELSRDKEFLTSLNIKAESIEGYLFPDTYYFNRSMNTRRIMKKMVDTFREKVTPDMIQRANNIGLNEHQFITFASMIGKESGNTIEKPLISAVFYNRMKKGMRLQSDPTAVYGLDGFEGKILRSHLKRKSPYNTYLIKGLPLGPIANPGLDSLKATLYPAPVDYLYFVSKNDGGHYFSSSLAEHNQAVKRYINLKNQQIQELKEQSSDNED